jgi:hypothetical protein
MKHSTTHRWPRLRVYIGANGRATTEVQANRSNLQMVRITTTFASIQSYITLDIRISSHYNRIDETDAMC